MTHRQYLVWQSWLEAEWNRPNRSDYYAMATTKAIVQKFRKDADEVKLDWFKIPFGFSEPVKVVAEEVEPPNTDWMKGHEPPPIMTKEMITAARSKMAKAAWMDRTRKGKSDGK